MAIPDPPEEFKRLCRKLNQDFDLSMIGPDVGARRLIGGIACSYLVAVVRYIDEFAASDPTEEEIEAWWPTMGSDWHINKRGLLTLLKNVRNEYHARCSKQT